MFVDVFFNDDGHLLFQEIKDVDISHPYFTKFIFKDNTYSLYQNSRINSMHVYEQKYQDKYVEKKD